MNNFSFGTTLNNLFTKLSVILKKIILGQYSLKTSVYVHFCTWFIGIGVLLIFSSFIFFLYFYFLNLIFTMIGLLNSLINYIKEKKRNKQSAENGYLSIVWIIFLLFMMIKGAIFN